MALGTPQLKVRAMESPTDELSEAISLTAESGNAGGADTIPKLFWNCVTQRADRVALRQKKLGIWHDITWEEYGNNVRLAGLGMLALGLQPGQRIVVISESRPEWIYVDMGAMCVGGVGSGIQATDAPNQVVHIINDSDSKILFVENDEQLNKALAVRKLCPGVTKVVVMEPYGRPDPSDDWTMSFSQFMELGSSYELKNPGCWNRCLKAAQPEDLAVLVYTSGATGMPKGAMISHRNLIFMIDVMPLVVPYSGPGNVLAFLPLCHIFQRLVSVFWQLRNDTTIHFVEGLDTVPENLCEVAPVTFDSPPRIWEKFYSKVKIAVDEATQFQRLAYRLAVAIGSRRADSRLAGKTVPWWLSASFLMADICVLRNLRRMIGIAGCRYISSSTAPVSADLVKWYLSIGADFYECYGQTENAGLATFMPGAIKLGTVGKAIPDTEVAVSPEDEILVKGPHVFMGYWNLPEKTAQTIVDGWLHTGDVGTLDDDGYLKVVDRLNDIFFTAGGKRISPLEIESQLKLSSYISDAVVIGDRREFLTCLVMIDYDNVAKFAQDQDIPFTNFAGLCQATEILELIKEEIETVNLRFARLEPVRDFRLIEVQLTPADDEMTPTMRLKRKSVNQKYSSLIETMYAAPGYGRYLGDRRDGAASIETIPQNTARNKNGE